MTPKEKSKELVDKYDNTLTYIESKSKAKQCALIAVDEIIKIVSSVDTMPPNCQKINEYTKEYWQEVKQEIINL